jgi:hypothetical protein
VATLLISVKTAAAALLIGVTTSNELIRFDSAAPGTILAGPTPITGLDEFAQLRAIDFRPLTGALYGVTTLDRVFVINPVTGAAHLVGTTSTTVGGSNYGIAFNPVSDRLRMVSDADRNVRIHPDYSRALAAGSTVVAAIDLTELRTGVK